MNYIEQFLKENNLKTGQKFKPKKSNVEVWFDDEYEMQGASPNCTIQFLTEIMTGEFEFAEELPKRWRAGIRGGYWSTSDEGYILGSHEQEDRIDEFRWATGNYFETKEQAEEYRKKLLIKQKYADMSDVSQVQKKDKNVKKWRATYDVSDGKIKSFYCNLYMANEVYFTTNKKCLSAINEIGEEDFKKYVLEV
ncbi:MAG: hypothetical protein RSA49_00160 [Anaerovoracaceae bacterium]